MVSSDNLSALPPLERLKRYRDLAAEAAKQSAAAGTIEIRDGFLTIAHHWADLATLLERAMTVTGKVVLPEVEEEAVPPKEPTG